MDILFERLTPETRAEFEKHPLHIMLLHFDALIIGLLICISISQALGEDKI